MCSTWLVPFLSGRKELFPWKKASAEHPVAKLNILQAIYGGVLHNRGRHLVSFIDTSEELGWKWALYIHETSQSILFTKDKETKTGKGTLESSYVIDIKATDLVTLPLPAVVDIEWTGSATKRPLFNYL
uniref:Uncharacterized protein n=1 Tax=Vespula pensylvanica TaxID=30213 RepID=A0A834P2V0_VESPE|nr:hypothetical protein H0235_008258 [Vespula pensylvanica]